MANCAQRRGYFRYVDGYIGLVQNREKKMSRRTIGVNLVAESADYFSVRWLGIPRRAKLPVRFYAHDTIGVIARLIC